MQEPKHTPGSSLCLLTLWGTGKRKIQSCVSNHRMVKADHRFFFLPLSLSFALTLWAAALRLITFSPCDYFCSLAGPKAVGGSLYIWPLQAKLASDFTFPCSWILCSCRKCDKRLLTRYLCLFSFFFCYLCHLSTCESTEYFGQRDKIVSLSVSPRIDSTR